MPVNLQSTPITNSTDVRIAFFSGSKMLKSLDPGDSAVLTITFDTITLFNSPSPPVPRTQNPNVAVTVPPGEIAFVTTKGGQTLLHHSRPGRQEQIVRFGAAGESKPKGKSKS